MKRSIVAVLLFCAMPVLGGVSVKPALTVKGRVFNVLITSEPLSSAVEALEMHLAHSVVIRMDSDPLINYEATRVTSDFALRDMVRKAGLAVTFDNEVYIITDPHEPTVTLDVKDAEVRDILKRMQAQCGIKNLVIDPNVGGTGTFLFRDLSCRAAFRTVFRSLDLTAITYDNSVVAVERRRPR